MITSANANVATVNIDAGTGDFILNDGEVGAFGTDSISNDPSAAGGAIVIPSFNAAAGSADITILANNINLNGNFRLTTSGTDTDVQIKRCHIHIAKDDQCLLRIIVLSHVFD